MKGSLSDQFMHEAGIRVDNNSEDEEFWRNSKYEIYQRNKSLSHINQRLPRLKSRDNELAKINIKDLETYKQYDTIQDESKK